ncbi:hypothetical protein M011DRAFT_477658 [Sporormia fimetaria CBS 119925]|uniref:Rhodopsin domain-containing protein n=1 Tax=Sporormia fimetaria CBS 119925 TaxID=1340428 RepID=A0A6A6VAT0_9PLEO|nr:hypothetical protein M011DRAFT_477658 [Sporormia fimetaria CBS 119925]
MAPAPANIDESLMTASPEALAAFAASLTPEQISQTQWRIEHNGRITMHDFQIALGVLFGLATFCLIGRLAIRLTSRRRLFLDDFFLIFAFVNVAAGTAILYKRIGMIYLEFAVLMHDPIAALMAFQQMDNLFEQSKWQLAYLLFLWTGIFAVKWCYLAFFYPLLRSMSRWLIRFYWFAVVFSVFCWLFLVIGEQLITCPYVGKESAKCFPELPASKELLLALFWICPALDGLTDLTILVIPIAILRQSQLRLLTKIGIGLFLSLSIFMFSCSIIRAAGTYYKSALDYPWQVFWLHSESCIGIIMASVTVYRSTLVGSNEVSDKLQSYLKKMFGRSSGTYVNDESDEKKGSFASSERGAVNVKIPRATLTGLRTKFGLGSRTQRTQATVDSQNSELDLMDYHAHMRAQMGASAKASKGESGS